MVYSVSIQVLRTRYLFDGAACCSGSLWYPGFTEYVKNNEFCKSPKRMYKSLGDKESSVKNQVFASVEDKTKRKQ